MSLISDNDINKNIQGFLESNFEEHKRISGVLKNSGKRSIEIGTTLNYGRVILPSNRLNKVTVVGKYSPPKKYAKLDYDKNNKTVKPVIMSDNGFYYGVAPTLNAALIMNEIKLLSIQTHLELHSFICKHANKFMAHENQADYLVELAEYITVGMLSNFGIKIRYCDELAEIVKRTVGGASRFVYRIVDASIEKRDNNQSHNNEASKLIYIYGCPPKTLMNCLKKFRYNVNAESVVECCENGEEIENIYKSASAVQFLSGHIYYNGVLLRTQKIEEDNNAANYHITSMKMYFERTTYAAVSALSDNYTKHPLLSETTKSKMIRVLRDDDKMRIIHLKQPETPTVQDIKIFSLLENINNYLQNSVSAVQIGVSANIITGDGYLLFGKRDGLAIDGNKLYPGSNGNAEIADSDVEFYKYSASEDYPAIDINTNFRIDFNGEMTRETLAELNELVADKNWNCYGLSLTGSISAETDTYSYDITDRRLHFNVIFEQTLSDDIYTIKKKQKRATESYENKEMIGVRLNFYKNVMSMLGAKLQRFLKLILSSKDIITTALAIIVFIVAISGNKEQNIVSWVSILFSVTVFSQSIVKVVHGLKRASVYAKMRRYDIIRRQDNKNKVMKKLLLGKEIHPVVAIMAMCYIEEQYKK